MHTSLPPRRANGALPSSFSSALILSSKEYEDEHSFDEIVPDGTLALHDPSGDVLYGVDMCVSPDTRGMRLARRLYEARKELVEQLGLRKIVIAGRIPHFLGSLGRVRAMRAREATSTERAASA